MDEESWLHASAGIRQADQNRLELQANTCVPELSRCSVAVELSVVFGLTCAFVALAVGLHAPPLPAGLVATAVLFGSIWLADRYVRLASLAIVADRARGLVWTERCSKADTCWRRRLVRLDRIVAVRLSLRARRTSRVSDTPEGEAEQLVGAVVDVIAVTAGRRHRVWWTKYPTAARLAGQSLADIAGVRLEGWGAAPPTHP